MRDPLKLDRRALAERAKKLAPFLIFAVFVLILALVDHLLHKFTYRQLRSAVLDLSPQQLIGAGATTAASYLILSSYDLMAFRYIGIRIPVLRAMAASFMAFAFSNNIGLANLAGSSVRLRIYPALGVKPVDVIKLIAFISVSFWLGFSALAGLTLTLHPLELPQAFGVSTAISQATGVILMAVSFVYIVLCARQLPSVRFWGHEFSLPSLRLAILQIVVASLDWSLAALTLYILLPKVASLDFGTFLSIFISAQVIALLAHIPGGIGVLEALIIYFVGPEHQSTTAIVGALLAFRAIYYFVPLIFASVLLAGHEIYFRRHAVNRLSQSAADWSRALVPQIAALLAFIAGSMLIFSSATPSRLSRLRQISELLPLPVIEVSHFFASCFGVGLILIAHSLIARSRSAWRWTIALLIGGAIASVFKGFDLASAAILATFLFVLIASRSEFDEDSHWLAVAFSTEWLLSILCVLSTAIWLSLFAYKHVQLHQEIWLRFNLNSEIPRSLRAALGASVTLIGFSLLHWFRRRNTKRQVIDQTRPTDKSSDRLTP